MTDKPRVFVCAHLPDVALDRLRLSFDVVLAQGVNGIADPVFLKAPESFDAIVSFIVNRVDASVIERATKLRVVANVAVGFDNIDLEACRVRNVFVTNTPGVLSEATADFAFGLLIAAARRIGEADRAMRSGGFPEWSPTLLVGSRVHGKAIGIVGLGRIGQAMARRARGFGMHVFYTQRNRLDPNVERALTATFVSADDLFAQSDFVSLHCPLTAETRHVASAARIASMKRTAIFVNTARGGCVDEKALTHALATKAIAAAGLDVFENEPRVDPELLALPNVVFAPHIGSGDEETRETMAHLAVDNVIAVLNGESPRNPVT
jgi:glyoxylate reductase